MSYVSPIGTCHAAATGPTLLPSLSPVFEFSCTKEMPSLFSKASWRSFSASQADDGTRRLAGDPRQGASLVSELF